MNYKDRLKAINLATLEQRRERGDLIEAFKVITGKKTLTVKSFSNSGMTQLRVGTL